MKTFITRHYRAVLLLTWPEIVKPLESQREGSSLQGGCPHFLKDIWQSFSMLLLITAGMLFADCLFLQQSWILASQDNPDPWIRTGDWNEVAQPQQCTVTEGLTSSQLQPLETVVFRKKKKKRVTSEVAQWGCRAILLSCSRWRKNTKCWATLLSGNCYLCIYLNAIRSVQNSSSTSTAAHKVRYLNLCNGEYSHWVTEKLLCDIQVVVSSL